MSRMPASVDIHIKPCEVFIYAHRTDELRQIHQKMPNSTFVETEEFLHINESHISGLRQHIESLQIPYTVRKKNQKTPIRMWIPDESSPPTMVKGVGRSKQRNLRNAGLLTVTDLEIVEYDDIHKIDGIGRALAARIKADVDSDSK